MDVKGEAPDFQTIGEGRWMHRQNGCPAREQKYTDVKGEVLDFQITGEGGWMRRQGGVSSGGNKKTWR